MYNHQYSYRDDSSFSRMPMRLLDTTDFSGRAQVSLRNASLNLDLLVQSVSASYAEHAQTEMHIGDTFSTLHFGKAPMTVNVSCLLPDYTQNYGKAELISLYRGKLRLTAVSKTGVVPVFKCKGAYIEGPWVGMEISESSEQEDFITVNISILVTKMSVMGDGSVSSFNYITGRNYATGSAPVVASGLLTSGAGGVTDIGDALSSIGSSLMDAAGNTLMGIGMSVAGDVGGALIDKVASIPGVNTVTGAISSGLDAAGNFIGEGASAIFGTASDYAGSATDFIESSASSAWDAAGNYIDKGMSVAGDYISSGASAVGGVISSGASVATSAVETSLGTGITFVKSTVSKLK